MAVFHPLKHTLARRERGIAERKKKRQTGETVEGVPLPKHTAARLIAISRSLAALRADIDRERSEKKVEVVYSHTFFPSLPQCSCAHILLYHTPTDWVRLKRRAGDTARILPWLHRHQRGGLSFHFVAVSIRIAGRKETTSAAGAESRHQSLLIKAPPQEYFKNTATGQWLSIAPLCLCQGSTVRAFRSHF